MVKKAPVPDREQFAPARPLCRALAVIGALLLACALPAAAQPYPAKSVRIVVPFAAGGIADLYARIIGQRLGEACGG